MTDSKLDKTEMTTISLTLGELIHIAHCLGGSDNSNGKYPVGHWTVVDIINCEITNIITSQQNQQAARKMEIKNNLKAAFSYNSSRYVSRYHQS